MRNPTKQQVQTVIDNFEKVLPMAIIMERSVDMDEIRVDHSCGTPMCHGGWYAASCRMGTHYESGKEQMAKDLGFESSEDLVLWAGQNPNIWGNDNGYCLFVDECAFNDEGEITSLQQIVYHWKGVQSRLPETKTK